jgi:hypothetical protein
MRTLSIAILAAMTMLFATGRTLKAAAPVSEGVIHRVMRQPLASQPGTDVTVITVEYPPGGAAPPHEHHVVSKNASTTEPARLLVFMITPHGVPLTTMLPVKPSP